MTTDGSSGPWYREGLRFECTRCGACCRGEGWVWVGWSEIERLAAFLGLGPEEFGRRFLRQVGDRLSLTDGPRGDCVFWDGDCRVYEARPRQCRKFPFWRDQLATEAAWRAASAWSPGLDRGRLYSQQEIEGLLDGEGPEGTDAGSARRERKDDA